MWSSGRRVFDQSDRLSHIYFCTWPYLWFILFLSCCFADKILYSSCGIGYSTMSLRIMEWRACSKQQKCAQGSHHFSSSINNYGDHTLAYAAPAITLNTNAQAPGGTVTVTGTGFGNTKTYGHRTGAEVNASAEAHRLPYHWYRSVHSHSKSSSD